MSATIRTDASAAIGIVRRTGLGKMRHLNVRYLWLQDMVKRDEVDVKKVPGAANPADLLTKNLPAEAARRHMEDLGMKTSTDRAVSAPLLSALGYVDDLNEVNADDWEERDGEVTRTHRRPRLELFTPLRVEGSPPARELTPTRTTVGVFVDSGEAFRRVDTWTSRSSAHLALSRRWTGTTTFTRRRS